MPVAPALRLLAFVGVGVLALAVPASAQDLTTTVPTSTVAATSSSAATSTVPTSTVPTSTVAATSSSAAVILGVAPSTVSLPGEVAGTQQVATDDLAFTGWGSAVLVVLAGALVASGLILVSASRRAAQDAGLSRSRSGPG